jgi:hypothetical protein
LIVTDTVDSRTVMAILGWSQPMMIVRYQHVIDRLKYDAARRVECYFWGKDRDGLGIEAQGGTFYPMESLGAAPPAITASALV